MKVAAKGLAKVVNKASAEQTLAVKNTQTKTSSPLRKPAVKAMASNSLKKTVTIKRSVAKPVVSAKSTAVNKTKKAVHPKNVTSKTSRAVVKSASTNKPTKPVVSKTVQPVKTTATQHKKSTNIIKPNTSIATNHTNTL